MLVKETTRRKTMGTKMRTRLESSRFGVRNGQGERITVFSSVSLSKRVLAINYVSVSLIIYLDAFEVRF